MPTFRENLLESVRLGRDVDVQRWLRAAGFDDPSLNRWGRALRRWRHRNTLQAALQTAAEVNHVAAIDRLLPLTSPHAIDEHGRTPFQLAAIYGQEADAERLLPVSNVHRTEPDGVPPVVAAAENGLLAIVSRLLPLCQAPRHRPFLNDALAAAAEKGHQPVVEALLPYTDPTAIVWRRKPWQRKTPLILAATNGHAGCVRAMLPFSNPNATDEQGWNALVHAASSGYEEVVNVLLPCTDLAAQSRTGETALHIAASQDRWGCVTALLPGSDPNGRDHEGHTPLMRNAMGSLSTGPAVDSLRTLEKLLRVSNPALRNRFDQNAFDLALNEALQGRRPWHAGHWARVDVLMFHEINAQQRDRAWQEGGPEHLPRWAAHLERQALSQLLEDDPTVNAPTKELVSAWGAGMAYGRTPPSARRRL